MKKIFPLILMALFAANSSFAACKISTADFSTLKERLGIKDGIQDNSLSIENWVHLQKAFLEAKMIEVSDRNNATVFFAENFVNTGDWQYYASFSPDQNGRGSNIGSSVVLKKSQGPNTLFDSRDGKRIASLIFQIIDDSKSFCEHSKN